MQVLPTILCLTAIALCYAGYAAAEEAKKYNTYKSSYTKPYDPKSYGDATYYNNYGSYSGYDYIPPYAKKQYRDKYNSYKNYYPNSYPYQSYKNYYPNSYPYQSYKISYDYGKSYPYYHSYPYYSYYKPKYAKYNSGYKQVAHNTYDPYSNKYQYQKRSDYDSTYPTYDDSYASYPSYDSGDTYDQY